MVITTSKAIGTAANMGKPPWVRDLGPIRFRHSDFTSQSLEVVRGYRLHGLRWQGTIGKLRRPPSRQDGMMDMNTGYRPVRGLASWPHEHWLGTDMAPLTTRTLPTDSRLSRTRSVPTADNRFSGFKRCVSRALGLKRLPCWRLLLAGEHRFQDLVRQHFSEFHCNPGYQGRQRA